MRDDKLFDLRKQQWSTYKSISYAIRYLFVIVLYRPIKLAPEGISTTPITVTSTTFYFTSTSTSSSYIHLNRG